MWIFMTTVQVDEDIKKELFTVAAGLRSKLGRRVSLSEAIKFLLCVVYPAHTTIQRSPQRQSYLQ
ncbi:hypothetical protein DRO57_09120 [Candidatus Bathyarchaeota archaeon]|nr:MAG: hypothetical protein DRO57_09120 [Candidatus Bathyarchaeota archaeon]